MRQETFEKAYNHYGEKVYAFMLSRTKNHDTAQDLTSQTFERAWQYRAQADSRKARAWIYQIAYHELCQYWRDANHMHWEPLDMTANMLAETLADPRRFEDELEKYEQAKQAQAATAQLPPLYGRVLELRAAGHSRERLAKWFAIPRATVDTRIFRARQEVRALCPAL